jgi:hypothetical protein
MKIFICVLSCFYIEFLRIYLHTDFHAWPRQSARIYLIRAISSDFEFRLSAALSGHLNFISQIDLNNAAAAVFSAFERQLLLGKRVGPLLRRAQFTFPPERFQFHRD